jgi:excisionase family DNA binding protein
MTGFWGGSIMDTEEKTYLTPCDLAQHFRTSNRQICKLARIGYLPGIKFGKLWRFRRDVIEEWERKQIPTNDIEKLANKIVERGG